MRCAAPMLPPDSTTKAIAYLLHAPDRNALAAILARIAHVAPGLSDAELGDLAVQLASDAATQGPVRLAIVASNQEQLARLASRRREIAPARNQVGEEVNDAAIARDDLRTDPQRKGKPEG